MKILFDQGVPKPLQAYLANHEIQRAFQLGWATKRNGELIALAHAAGFEMLVTTDQNLPHQQNLQQPPIAVFILGRGNWPEIEPHARMKPASRCCPPASGFFARCIRAC